MDGGWGRVDGVEWMDLGVEVEGWRRTPHQRPHAGDQVDDPRFDARVVDRAAEGGGLWGGAPADWGEGMGR